MQVQVQVQGGCLAKSQHKHEHGRLCHTLIAEAEVIRDGLGFQARIKFIQSSTLIFNFKLSSTLNVQRSTFKRSSFKLILNAPVVQHSVLTAYRIHLE